MPVEPDIQIISDSIEKHLESFSHEAQVLREKNQWRCLYADLDPSLIKEQISKDIILTFLKSSFEDADDVRVFWLSSGPLFIFFKGPVRAVIRDYENFLDFISEEDKRLEYHFFWELSRFWGYFDQVLAGVVEPKPKKKETEIASEKVQKPHVLDISPDLRRQRFIRYKPLLLIVEDDRTARHSLQTIMEKYCDIAVAWTAEQARVFYQAMLPNIVLLDIELPDGDGRELLELFCNSENESFIVMVSSHDDEKIINQCLSAGAQGFISKPAREAQLLKFINQYNKARRDRKTLGA